MTKPKSLPMVDILKQLEAQEAIILRNRSDVSASVAAFRKIRDNKLYRAKCKTLQEYVILYDRQYGLKRLYHLDEYERQESEFQKVTGVTPRNERVHRAIKNLGAKIDDDAARHKVFRKIAAASKSELLTTTVVHKIAADNAEKLGISGFGDEYPTPDWLYQPLNEVFHFEVDVAANSHNHKCKKFFNAQQDGLKQDWTKFNSVWCNPPFSSIGDWVQKGYEAALTGTNVAIVSMTNSETRWFQEYCWCADLLLVNGRVQFNNAAEANRFGSIVILFHLSRLPEVRTLTDLKNPNNVAPFRGAILYEAPMPLAEVAWATGDYLLPGCKTEKQFMTRLGYRHVLVDGEDYWL